MFIAALFTIDKLLKQLSTNWWKEHKCDVSMHVCVCVCVCVCNGILYFHEKESNPSICNMNRLLGHYAKW